MLVDKFYIQRKSIYEARRFENKFCKIPPVKTSQIDENKDKTTASALKWGVPHTGQRGPVWRGQASFPTAVDRENMNDHRCSR